MAIVLQLLQEYIKVMREKVGEHYISLSFVSTADGTVLMYDSKDPSIDNKGSGSYQFGIMKSVAMGIKKMKNEKDKNQNIYEITITYEGQKHILALSDSQKYMIHLILDESANAALVKKHMEKTVDLLTKKYGIADSKSIEKVDITTYHQEKR